MNTPIPSSPSPVAALCALEEHAQRHLVPVVNATHAMEASAFTVREELDLWEDRLELLQQGHEVGTGLRAMLDTAEASLRAERTRLDAVLKDLSARSNERVRTSGSQVLAAKASVALVQELVTRTALTQTRLNALRQRADQLLQRMSQTEAQAAATADLMFGITRRANGDAA